MAKGYGRVGGGGQSMGNQNAMRQQLKDLQRQMEEQQQRIAATDVTATVGGAVKIVMSGDQICKSVTIDPEFLKDTDAEMLQDILLSGINMALEQSKKLQDDQMGSMGSALSSFGLGF